MFTIFDRYLFKRYAHVFAITFMALFGLFVIIDAFTNVDEFLSRHTSSLLMLSHMLRFYAFRGCQFFLMIGGTVTVISAVVVFSLVQKHGELNPILSAGIPTYRLVVPVLWATLFVEGLMVLDQELVIPNIASQLQLSAGNVKGVIREVEPATDFSTRITVAGRRMSLTDRRLDDAEFVLPVPTVVEELTTVKAREAVYHQGRGPRPNGWLLTGVTPRHSNLRLTPEGSKLVMPWTLPEQMFIATDVSFDRLYHGDKNFELLSTAELMRRVKNPSFAAVSIQRKSMYLHTRFTNPVIDTLVVLLTIPFVARRESRALLINMALCAAAMTGVFAVRETFRYLGGINVVTPDLAAWAPVVITGTASAWFSGWVRT
jgi:lipopolysaccharide export system permease protein